MPSYDQCKCVSDSDQPPKSTPGVVKKTCVCGRKVCKDVCSSKPCYKGTESLEGIVAKQMMELISCGCNQLVCKDTCTKRPCNEKKQIKGEECENISIKPTRDQTDTRESCNVSEGIIKSTKGGRDSCQNKTCDNTKCNNEEIGHPKFYDANEIIKESYQVETEVDAKDDSIGSDLEPPKDSTLPIYFGANNKTVKSTFNPEFKNLAKNDDSEILTDAPLKLSNNAIEEYIKSQSIEASMPESRTQQEEIVRTPIKEDVKIQEKDNNKIPCDDENKLNNKDVEECRCIIEPKAIRTSKIPRLIPQKPTTQGQTNASVETDPRKRLNILKKDTDDCTCLKQADNMMNVVKPETSKEKKITSPVPERMTILKKVMPEGEIIKSKAKPKQNSCGCNRTDCKDTCKYKPCKNANCGCNREVCKDSCKRKPCFRPAKKVTEDIESVIVEEAEEDMEILTVADTEEIQNVEEEIKTDEAPQNIKMEIITESPCGCTLKSCKPTCTKKPCHPDTKDATCGCNMTECIDTCSKKPCANDGRIFSTFPKYVKNLIGEIRCICKKPETAPKFIKNDSHIGATLSVLKLGVESLQEKCKNKDIIIDALRLELQNHTESNVFSDLLSRVAHPVGKKRDYDRYMVAQELPVSECVKLPQICDCNKDGFDKTDPSPLQIVDVKRLPGQFVLVKWIPSNNQKILGYEVYMEGKVATRVLKRDTTATVMKLDDDSNSNDVNINIYAFTEEGRCFPPATAEYKSVVEG